MTNDPDDKRALFQRIVDDIKQQIRDDKLLPNDPVPSAKRITEIYDVSSVTAQRALRDLQTQRITYGILGKGTFVHPDALDLLRPSAGVLDEPIEDDPDLNRRVAEYLAAQQEILSEFHHAADVRARNKAVNALVEHTQRHNDLIDEALKYQAARGNYAKPPGIAAQRPEDHPDYTPPARKRKKNT